MKQIISPLRYPGSKQRVIDKIKPYWDTVSSKVSEYREPFLGGASIFLSLNTTNKAVWLNDKDNNIATLFRAIRDTPEELCEMVSSTKPTIELWTAIQLDNPIDELSIAFRILFLNRTNYSGILKAAPIGGFRQGSQYTVDCRWNPKELVKRIKDCSEKLKGTEITNKDFFYIIIKPSFNPVFMMIDPPYYKMGNDLYDETMTIDDHVRLRDLLASTKHKFLLTYDNCQEVRSLYREIPDIYVYETRWKYTTNSSIQKIGKELFLTNIDLTDADLENELGLISSSL